MSDPADEQSDQDPAPIKHSDAERVSTGGEPTPGSGSESSEEGQEDSAQEPGTGS